MSDIKVLDCTLRDGGYVNDWQFGENCMRRILERLRDASIDYIECGFLSQTKEADATKSIFNTVEAANAIFSTAGEEVALMINCGEYNSNDIPIREGGNVSIIRIAFHKRQIDEAQYLCVALKEKGYRVFLQPMVTMGYSDAELLSLIEWANENNPEAFYIVDSFGTMRKNDVLRMFYLIDNNLSQEIKIGFHSHNNLQLSFSNAQELMHMQSRREIIIDSSVFGMGRGAGNLCTELLTQYINENIGNKYDLIPILEIMDEFIMPIYTDKPWGYSAPYYIAAINGCHPNYASYLMDRQSLCVQDINAIIKQIPEGEKQLFRADLIEKMYLEYQSHMVDDSEVLEQLRELCDGREVLLLAPGKTLLTKEGEINAYIRANDPVVFAINHIPERIRYDVVFISNLKRFKKLDDAARRLGDRLICTSNISMLEDGDIKTLNYTSYLNADETISDNAGLMFINVLRKVGIKKVALAGYDGFQSTEAENYFDGKLSLNMRYKDRKAINAATKQYFAKIAEHMDVMFLTPSAYCDDRLGVTKDQGARTNVAPIAIQERHKKMRIVAVVPMKLNNQRLPQKNTRKFTNGEPLCHYVLETLRKVPQIDEIYVYCSDSRIKEYLPDGIRYLTRPKTLDLDSTTMNEVLRSFAKDVPSEIYVMAHTTAPFVSAESIHKGIRAVAEGGYDSSFSAKKVQDFLWKDGAPFNYDLENIPRTQDLQPIYEETSGFYVYRSEMINDYGRRIGNHTFIVEVGEIEGIDIDEEEDFMIADAIFNYIKYLRGGGKIGL